MPVTGLANLAVKVEDLDAACRFYEDAGAEVRDRMQLAQRRARRRVPGPGDDHAVHPRPSTKTTSTSLPKVSFTPRCSPTIWTSSSRATRWCGGRRSSKAHSEGGASPS